LPVCLPGRARKSYGPCPHRAGRSSHAQHNGGGGGQAAFGARRADRRDRPRAELPAQHRAELAEPHAARAQATPSSGPLDAPARLRRGRAYRYARYSFSNRSDDIKAILCEHLDLLGIRWTRPNDKDIAVARRKDVARLDEFVGRKA
jgi:hypothetical protein